ncbi:hypothetical protein F2Q70_00018701 [Brassica cretica]|uniref:Uncharacterized protein n=1 Tax=Brassica cretica TaxID=69181 RepID=A0A8S9HYG7_BRACR|nr:hypothetical protein F2Q70_00018701 [Brassica cretica]
MKADSVDFSFQYPQTLSRSVDSLSLKDSIDDAFLKLPDPDACFCIPHKALSKPVPVWECLVAHGYST